MNRIFVTNDHECSRAACLFSCCHRQVLVGPASDVLVEQFPDKSEAEWDSNVGAQEVRLWPHVRHDLCPPVPPHCPPCLY